jgi:hypothetical protein
VDEAARDEAAHNVKIAVQSKHQVVLDITAPVA